MNQDQPSSRSHVNQFGKNTALLVIAMLIIVSTTLQGWKMNAKALMSRSSAGHKPGLEPATPEKRPSSTRTEVA